MSDPYLMGHERRVLTVRGHPVPALGRPAAVMTAGLGLAIWVSLASRVSLEITWSLWGASVLWMGWRVAVWLTTYLILTNLRVLYVHGVITQSVAMSPLIRVVDMQFERSVLGQLLGYGELNVVTLADEHPFRKIGNIPNPEKVYLSICSMLFTAPERRDPDDRRAADS